MREGKGVKRRKRLVRKGIVRQFNPIILNFESRVEVRPDKL